MSKWIRADEVIKVASDNCYTDQWGQKVIDISTLKQMCNKDLDWIEIKTSKETNDGN